MLRSRRPPRIDLNMNGDMDEDEEGREPPAPANPRTLKGLLQRNQIVISMLQYASTACVMFIPASFKYYELAAEGCYSMSQLIHYFNRVVTESALEKCSKLEDVCVLLTRGISHVEVLIEKGASALIGSHGRTQAVMFVECLKSCLRLLIIFNRRAPSLLIHWERDRRPGDPKLDVAHYARWYRLTYAHHVTGGRSSDAIIDAHSSVAAEAPPMAAATRAFDGELRDSDVAYEENTVLHGDEGQRGERERPEIGDNEDVVLTVPIVGRRSGINIRSLRIPKHAVSSVHPSTPTVNTVNNPDFGIYDNLSPNHTTDFLPLAQPVRPVSRGDANDNYSLSYFPEVGDSLSRQELHQSSPDTDTERSSGPGRDGRVSHERSGRSKSSSRSSKGGFFSFFIRRRVEDSASDDSESSCEDDEQAISRHDDDGTSDRTERSHSGSEDERDDTFDRDMYVALSGTPLGFGGGNAMRDYEDDQDEDVLGCSTPRKPARELHGDSSVVDQAQADFQQPGLASDSGGEHVHGTTSSGVSGGGDYSSFLDDSIEKGLSAEKCIYLGEILYIIRPALYSWTVHFVGAHTPRMPIVSSENGENGASGENNVDLGREYVYDSDDDDWTASPKDSSQSFLRLGVGESALQRKTQESGITDLSSSIPGGARYLPAFSAALKKVPQLAYIASDAVDLQRALGLLVSLLVEVLSVQLTARGLFLCRVRAAQAYYRASPTANVDPQATLKAISNLYPHSFDSELKRRRTALFFYLIRTPVFDKATLPMLQLASRILSRVPLISSLPEHVISMLRYLNKTHFYSSTSN